VAIFMFTGASGRQPGASPYEVITGVVVEDRDVWNLSQVLQDAELRHFGRRFSPAGAPRARQLLSSKVFRQASLLAAVPLEERRELARACLDHGAGADRRQQSALAHAKLAYVGEALEAAARFRCRLVASIVGRRSPRPYPGQLRKDFAYLFERFFYCVDDTKPSPLGIVVGRGPADPDGRLLAQQMACYFRGSLRGRQRASLVLAEPLAATGELRGLVELGDLVAYITAWAFRTKELLEPARRELGPFKEQVRSLRYRVVRDIGDNPNFVVWGFAVVPDLRMREDRELEG
jgi:hypothetical protein